MYLCRDFWGHKLPLKVWSWLDTLTDVHNMLNDLCFYHGGSVALPMVTFCIAHAIGGFVVRISAMFAWVDHGVDCCCSIVVNVCYWRCHDVMQVNEVACQLLPPLKIAYTVAVDLTVSCTTVPCCHLHIVVRSCHSSFIFTLILHISSKDV